MRTSAIVMLCTLRLCRRAVRPSPPRRMPPPPRPHTLTATFFSTEKKKTKKKPLPRPTTPLGMLAWDAREEMEARERHRERSGATPVDAREDMSYFEIVANNRIREAMEAGEFADLKGKGKPRPNVGLTAAGVVDDGRVVANKILANAGVAPDWISERKPLLRRIRELRARAGDGGGSSGLMDGVLAGLMGGGGGGSGSTGRAIGVSAAEVEELNRDIGEYNRKVPVPSKQLPPFQA